MGSENGMQNPDHATFERSAPRVYQLLVSDSKLIASQLRWSGFRRLDLRTQTVTSAQMVLEALEAGPIDAVVLESKVFKGDVFELCTGLKRKHGALPVVVIGEGALSSSMLSKVEASGCDEVLSAPLSQGQLYHVLAEHLDLPRRRNYRVKVKASVSARGTFTELDGEIYDLAVSGARIRMTEPFIGESQLSVAFEAPEGALDLPGSVVWHRPSARGGELAVQFKPVSEEVAERLETLATWRVEQQGDSQVVVLQRSLNERANFTGLAQQLRGHVIFDLQHLSLIASVGVGAWVAFLRKIPEEVTFELRHCPVSFCVQASYIPGMLGRGRVNTFYGPYFCAGCNAEVEREFDASAIAITDPMKAPPVACSVCGASMEFEDLPDRFFKFLKD